MGPGTAWEKKEFASHGLVRLWRKQKAAKGAKAPSKKSNTDDLYIADTILIISRTCPPS